MTFERFFVVWVVVIGLGVASVVLVRDQFSEQAEGVTLGGWGIFFSLNGFFFAVLIGLLIAQLLVRFHRMNEVVRLEASALSQMKQALRLSTEDGAIEDAIRSDIRTYANAVLEVEWPEMAHKHRLRGEGGAMEQLYSLLAEVRAMELQGTLDVIARGMLVDSVIDVTNLRAERLHLSAEQLSPLVRAVVLFLSLVIVFSFTLVDVGTMSIHIVMVILLGTAVLLLNLALADLARPMVGIWNVSPDPMQLVATAVVEGD